MGKRSKISMGKRLAVYVRDNWMCQYCGLIFEPGEDNLSGRYAPLIEEQREGGRDWDYIWLELDHIHPVALGGDDSIENLRAACSPCNRKKLATTRLVKWPNRIALALEVLSTREATEETALKAAAYLLGFSQSELPKPKTIREVGY